jgi:redox-sensing transcriptional repressor
MSSSKEKSVEIIPVGDAPKAVVSRLSFYLRELQNLITEGVATVSSSQLGKRLGFTDAQVRKDLAYFGHLGYPGVGYRCDELVAKIKSILGTDRSWPVALIGVGNLGRALLRYRGFEKQGFRIVAAFDCASEKIGQLVEDIPIHGLSEIKSVIVTQGIRLAILAVPSTEAQFVANEVVAAGVEGVLNFAPVTLSLPNHIRIVGVDLAIELEQLSFAAVNSTPKS